MTRTKSLNFVVALLMMLNLIACEDNKQHEQGHQSMHGDETIALSELFDVSGAMAVVTATKGIGDSALSGSTSKQENDVLKILGDGSFRSVFQRIHPSWNLKIAVIEIGPDGSLYIGLDWGIWIRNNLTSNRDGVIPNFSAPPSGQNVALFRITPKGRTEIVDPDINGMAQFHNKEFLSKKQIQFDAEGAIYYLGRQGNTTVLKKKDKAGKITQIGNSRMEVRDFMVASNGMVIFNGANAGDWDTQWLRIFANDGSVSNIYYRENGGWLRSYFFDKNNNLILVGNNLILGNDRKNYNGIVRVNLENSKVHSIDHLINDSTSFAQYEGLTFSSANQLLLGDDGSVYAIVNHYGYWGESGYVRQDKVFRILDSSGKVNIKEFPVDENYSAIKIAKILGNHIVYLSSLNGVSALFKISLEENSSVQEITGIKSNIEIYNFAYHPLTNKLLYDVYDLQANSSYIIEQDIQSTLVIDEKNLANFNIIDLVPFMAI